jgi:long-chain acyl-CoA synthetase
MTVTEAQLFEQYVRKYKEKYSFDLGFFLKAACEHGISTEFIYKEKTIAIGTLYKKVATIQTMLQEKGIQKADRVMIFIPNCIAFYGAYYAVLQTGAIVIPINTFLADPELEHIIQDAEGSMMITIGSEYDRLEKMCAAINKNMVVLSLDEQLEDIQESSSVPIIVKRNENDLAVILYTSGTTGVPKGVALSSKNILTNMLQTYTRLFSEKLSVKHTLIAALPLFHSFSQNTCVFSSVYLGASIVLLPKIERRLLLDALKKYKPTIFLGVPALYGLLCLLKNAYLDSIQIFVAGGDALSNRIRQAFALMYNRKICNGYGLSEASPVIAVNLTDEISESGCVGMVLPGINYEIRDEKNNELLPGEIGNLHVSGDNIMLGYYKAEELTQKVLQNGWLDTGDRAYINHIGHIVLVGREKELIKYKGINVYPQEIENVIAMDEAVIRVGVVGKKSDQLAEEYPIAYVQIRAECKDNIDEIKKRIQSLCKERLANYKVPKEFFCTTEHLPTTVTGKVDKKNLDKVKI